MKSIFHRSFMAILAIMLSLGQDLMAQTTVTIPTIPCSTCNGPGAFNVSAPSCASGLVAAPLTMSWGAAAGATSYTILIATDANLTTNLKTYTLTGTSLSVPAIALEPSITYYWTVVANSLQGSTKATGTNCTFSTNTTWTGASTTSGFPKGTGAQQMLINGVAGGYSTCQSGDGTCASGDNLICNPQGVTLSTGNTYTPHWSTSTYGPVSGTIVEGTGMGGVNLIAEGQGTPPSGTETGFNPVNSGTSFSIYQAMSIQNTTGSPVNYRAQGWAKSSSGGYGNAMNINFLGQPNSVGVKALLSQASNSVTNTWTYYTWNLSLPAGAKTSEVRINILHYAYLTDLVLCKL